MQAGSTGPSGPAGCRQRSRAGPAVAGEGVNTRYRRPSHSEHGGSPAESAGTHHQPGYQACRSESSDQISKQLYNLISDWISNWISCDSKRISNGISYFIYWISFWIKRISSMISKWISIWISILISIEIRLRMTCQSRWKL